MGNPGVKQQDRRQPSLAASEPLTGAEELLLRQQWYDAESQTCMALDLPAGVNRYVIWLGSRRGGSTEVEDPWLLLRTFNRLTTVLGRKKSLWRIAIAVTSRMSPARRRSELRKIVAADIAFRELLVHNQIVSICHNLSSAKSSAALCAEGMPNLPWSCQYGLISAGASEAQIAEPLLESLSLSRLPDVSSLPVNTVPKSSFLWALENGHTLITFALSTNFEVFPVIYSFDRIRDELCAAIEATISTPIVGSSLEDLDGL